MNMMVRSACSVVKYNEVGDVETVTLLMKNHSTHGWFVQPVIIERGVLRAADRFNGLSYERESSNVVRGFRGVDFVIDCMGVESAVPRLRRT